MDANFLLLNTSRVTGWPQVLGCILLGLKFERSNFDQPEFQIKTIPSTMCVKFNTKDKGSIISFIFHDKLDGHTKHIVIADFFQSAVL
jgi:hypothetical protein